MRKTSKLEKCRGEVSIAIADTMACKAKGDLLSKEMKAARRDLDSVNQDIESFSGKRDDIKILNGQLDFQEAKRDIIEREYFDSCRTYEIRLGRLKKAIDKYDIECQATKGAYRKGQKLPFSQYRVIPSSSPGGDCRL